MSTSIYVNSWDNILVYCVRWRLSGSEWSRGWPVTSYCRYIVLTGCNYRTIVIWSSTRCTEDNELFSKLDVNRFQRFRGSKFRVHDLRQWSHKYISGKQQSRVHHTGRSTAHHTPILPIYPQYIRWGCEEEESWRALSRGQKYVNKKTDNNSLSLAPL